MPQPDAFSLSEGAVFHDQYEVVRRIDSGAMGTVYEVVDRRTKRRRALKVMLARFADNPDVTERFRREATITADVVSEHVVETFDAGVDEASGLPFLVMELLRGEDLGKVVARGPLPHAEVATLLMQAASALDKMHAAGIIHRDLKPENLFITRRDDGAPRLKILDFGIAKVIEKSAPSATTTRNMGTPVYMSPEQVTGAGTVGPPADLYAVGQLAYTMLVGEPYWLEDALAHETVYPLLLRIMEGVVEPASERALRTRKVALPPAFDAWFAKATAHDPEARYPGVAESIIALAEALDVPRPALPSHYLETSLGTAVTDAPPDDAEEPLLLIPGPAALPRVPGPRARDAAASPPDAPPPDDALPDAPLPDVPDVADLATASTEPIRRQDEALRTLSPVSTLPGESPRPAEAARPLTRRRKAAIVAIGAAFFVTGVVGAVLIARPARHDPSAASPSSPPAPSALSASLSPVPVPAPSAAPSSPPAGPSAAPTASASSDAAPSASSSSPPVPVTSRPVRPWTRPVSAPRPPAKPTSTSTRPYVDPRRDL